MKKSRFSEAQIVGVLKEVELGAKVVETCRKHCISEPTYHKWEPMRTCIEQKLWGATWQSVKCKVPS